MDMPNSLDSEGTAGSPLIALWTLPFIMMQAWMTGWIGMAARHDEAERNCEEGQIPVPTVFQDKKDHELFA